MRTAAVSRDGGRVNDRGAGFEVVDRRLCEVKVRKYIGSKGLFQLPACNVSNVVLGMLFGSVVHEDVETPQLLNRSCHHLFTRFFVADVAGQKQAFAAFLFDLAPCFFGILVFVEVTDGNVRSLFGEKNGDGSTCAAFACRAYNAYRRA